LLGSHLAGAAIEGSMLGAAHAAANPLTARHEIPHGEAIGIVLPSVLRFNAAAVDPLYRELWPAGGEGLAARVEAIRAAIGLPATLGEFGVDRADLGELARSAGEEWTGRFNPRPADPDVYEAIYAAAL
jgi:alcohol dehydrogenase